MPEIVIDVEGPRLVVSSPAAHDRAPADDGPAPAAPASEDPASEAPASDDLAAVPSVVVTDVAVLVAPDGAVTAIPIEEVRADGAAWTVAGRGDRFRAEARWTTDGDVATVVLTVTHDPPTHDPPTHDLMTRDGGTPEPVETGVRVAVDLPGHARRPDWMVPGCFYRHNRFAECTRVYPRAVAGGGDLSQLESSWWSFRSDRAAVPAVLGWTDVACVGLATDPESELGLHGVGFALDDGTARIWLDAPYREEPVVFDGRPEPAPADVQTHRWQPGEQHVVRYRLTVAAPHPHAYDGFVRHLYARDRDRHPTAPWMGPAEAAALTAHGLHRWHWRPEHGVLYETAAFDRAHPELDRPHMHVGWVSGTPWAHALLAYGRRSGHGEYVEAATQVLDTIAGARTPAGTLWGMWTRDRGWRCGWNPSSDWLHARTLAEATLFLLRAEQLERAHGPSHGAWVDAVTDNLRFVVARQDERGDLGAYYDHRTGEVVDRRSAAGILWIAALVEAADALGEPGWLGAARRAGAHYATFVEDAFIYGAPEDVHLAPTSEDAVNALIAYVALHDADGDEAWLRLAARAADWLMTFRYSYNVRFSPQTLLGHYDFRSRGADQASPSNQHLGSYSLVGLAELLRVWRLTGDDYYRDRARDNLDCFLQFVAREDGDFNAGRGMVSERYYQTNCFQAKGSLLTLSHAWCVGVALHGCLVAMDEPEVFGESNPLRRGERNPLRRGERNPT